MSTLGSYPTRTFKESQKFLVLDPETQSASLVPGRDLVEYITPQSNYVFAEQSRAVAQNEDYQIGALIQTAGDVTAGDSFAGTFLVVPGGDGDFPMANGNDLLIIRGDVLLREQLASNAAGQGAALVNGATIYVGSVAELEALTVSVGYVVELNAGGRSGTFDVIAGDFSAELAADTLNGVFVGLADDPTALTKVAKRRGTDYNVGHFGAVYSGDESAIAQAMINVLNELKIPYGKTLTAKNIQANSDTVVRVDGTLKMPDACVDFDRAIYGYSVNNVKIYINEIDGNFANQSGTLGTHLIYLIDPVDAEVKIKYAHDHYYVSGGSLGTTDSGNRNASTGAVYMFRPIRGSLHVDFLFNWGREGVYVRQGDGTEVYLGHAQGTETGSQYSGIQVEGFRNKLLRASVDLAKASAIGFDTIDGEAYNLIATNALENHGLNFGHLGFPANNSVVSNVLIDKSRLNGVQVSSGTGNLSISNFSISNSGDAGISVSDGSQKVLLSNGYISNSGTVNARTFGAGALLRMANVDISGISERSVEVSGVTGEFQDGETVTTSTSSGVVGAFIKGGTNQILLISSLTSGAFVAAETITGVTSGATATVVSSGLPIDASTGGGSELFTDRRIDSGGDIKSVTKLPNGTAIVTLSFTVSATAATNQTFTIPYPSSIVWASSPQISGCITSAASTAGYTINRLEFASTTTDAIVRIRTDTTQSYSISMIVLGKYLE